MALNERTIGVLLLFTLLFFRITFDPNMAAIFSSMVIIIFLITITDKKRDYLLESKPNKAKSLMYGVIGYVSFIIISMISFWIFKRTSLVTNYSFNSVADAFANSMSVMMSNYSPALAGSVLLLVLSFIILIPLIETWLQAIVFEFLGEVFPGFKQINLKQARTWFLISLVSLGYMALHFTAKGLTNWDALIMVLIFFAISLVLIIKEGQILGAIFMHMIANGIAILSRYDITLANNPIVIWGVVAFVGYLIINSKKIKILSKVGF